MSPARCCACSLKSTADGSETFERKSQARRFSRMSSCSSPPCAHKMSWHSKKLQYKRRKSAQWHGRAQSPLQDSGPTVVHQDQRRQYKSQKTWPTLPQAWQAAPRDRCLPCSSFSCCQVYVKISESFPGGQVASLSRITSWSTVRGLH